MISPTRSRLAAAAGASLLALAACSGSSGTAPTTSVTATDSVQVIKVGWAAGKPAVPSNRVAVRLGSKVRLEVTSDVDEVVHVHLNDAEQDVKAGGTVVFTFTADKPGIFDVEVHKADQLVVQLQVS